MSLANKKSGSLTNRDAVPQVRNQAAVQAGMVREAAGTVEITDGDNTWSTYRLFEIPSNARVSSLRVYSDDCGTNTAADFGLFDTTENGSAVVDQDFFATAVVLGNGALNGTDVAREAGTSDDVDDIEKPLWSCLGLATDPKKTYDVVARLTVNADGGGTLSALCQYVI